MTIRHAGREVVSELEPLYATLHEHQASIAPTLAGMPARSSDESWRRRRAEYDRWLATPGAFVLLAERAGKTVGYALVSLADGFQGWTSGEQVADVLDLVVVPEERGHGIGSALMNAVERDLAAAGIAEVRLRVIAANAQALQFYAARGMMPISQTLLRRINVTG